MIFKEMVKANRSYRGFDQSVKPTRQDLEALVDLARYCPSSVNFQPFKYLISCTETTNAVIQPLTGWARRISDQKLPREGHNPTAFIIICYDNNIGPGKERFLKDIGIVAQTILLGAIELNFGGIMIGNFSSFKVSSALNLERHLEPVLIIALGKPDEQVKLVEVDEGDIAYRRDKEHITYVPKRSLDQVLINRNKNDV